MKPQAKTQSRKGVRKTKRARIIINAVLKVNKTPYDAVIHEVGNTGVRLVINTTQVFGKDSEFILSFKIKDISFDGMPCELIWEKKTPQTVILGLKFINIDMVKQDMIKRYIEKLD